VRLVGRMGRMGRMGRVGRVGRMGRGCALVRVVAILHFARPCR
jgi:hypothetical protein